MSVIIISIIYLSILHRIYIWRTKQAVYFKSPKMILVGGWCLWVDSIINIYINTSIYPNDLALRYEYVCISSIATTFIFNQVGYLCIIFRALRIFKIMVLEKQYLD